MSFLRISPLFCVGIGLLWSMAGAQEKDRELSTEAPVENPESALNGSFENADADAASIFNRRNARTIQLLIPAPRGPILDREGMVMARTKVAYKLALQFEQFSDESEEFVIRWGRERMKTAEKFDKKIRDYTDAELYQHYRYRRWLPLAISSHMSKSDADKIRPNLSRGLELQAVYLRDYPGEKLASHIIGYTGQAGKLPTGPINLNEPMWELTEGRDGLEKLFDEKLQGVPANLRYVFNEKGEMLLREQKNKPRIGGAVVTTLNGRWQKWAEQVLTKRARRGAFVVVDVATGEVLVLASNPRYDLNQWVPNISQKTYDALREDPDKPLYARAFQGQYPPGSSFKPVIALAALDRGAISPETTIYCPAYVQYGNHKLWNWSRSAYGDLAVVAALKWSNNPWFAQVGNRVGSAEFLAVARNLGYGMKTGLPLVGEAAGLIPTPEYVRRTQGRRITEGDAANWSIGQGAVLATPLQAAQAMAGLGNGGVLPKLHLVMQVQDTYGRVIQTAQPEPNHYLKLSDTAIETVRKGMGEVVSGGTGRSASLGWVSMGGKTGTSQWGPKRKKQGMAWFVGFIPKDQPRLAFAAMYEGRPGQRVSGSGNAAPMVPAFFNHFKEEIKDLVSPAPKAVAVVEEDPVAEQQKSEGIMRALPVSEEDLIDLEAEWGQEMGQAAPGNDAGDNVESVPQALPVEEQQQEEMAPPPNSGRDAPGEVEGEEFRADDSMNENYEEVPRALPVEEDEAEGADSRVRGAEQ